MEYQEIRMNNIILSKEERSYTEGEIMALAGSIGSMGLLSPLTVKRIAHTDRYEMLSGNKRFYACRLLGMSTVPSVIVDAPTEIARATLKKCDKEDFIKESVRIKRLFRDNVDSAEEIALLTGYSLKELLTLLKLTKLSDFEREAIRKNAVSKEIAAEIAEFDDITVRCALLGESIQRRLKAPEVIALCEREKQGKRSVEKRKAVRSPKFRDLRLFDNTLTRAVSLLKEAGVKAEIDASRKSGITEYTILIAE